MDIPDLSTPKAALRHAAQVLGGQAALAKLLGYSDRRNVSPWFKTDRPFPADFCPKVEAATKAVAVALPGTTPVTCEQLRPDVEWCVLREPTNQQAA